MNEQQVIDFVLKNWLYLGVMVGAYFLTQYIPAAWFRFRDTWAGQKTPGVGVGDFFFGKEMRLLMAYVWCLIGVWAMPVAEGSTELGWFSKAMIGILLGMATTNGRDLAKLCIRIVIRKLYPDDTKAELQAKIDEVTQEHHEKTTRKTRAPSTTRSMLAAVEKHFD